MRRDPSAHNAVAPALAQELIDRVRALSLDPRDVVLVAESVLVAVVARCFPDAVQDAVVATLQQRLPKRVAEVRERGRRRPTTLN